MNQHEIALKTISSNAFWWLVMDALSSGKPLSCVRMGDGERAIWLETAKLKPRDLLQSAFAQSPERAERLGIVGLPAGVAASRLKAAANGCTYFAPSVSGIWMEGFNLYDFWRKRAVYVDNFFVDQWTDLQITDLFKSAGHVLFIHRSLETADSMQLRVQGNLKVKVDFIRLDNWKECDDVIEKALPNTAPLVLFSGGPAGKYIAAEIAHKSVRPKVVIDIGHAADRFTLSYLPADAKAAEAFHAEWMEKQVHRT